MAGKVGSKDDVAFMTQGHISLVDDYYGMEHTHPSNNLIYFRS